MKNKSLGLILIIVLLFSTFLASCEDGVLILGSDNGQTTTTRKTAEKTTEPESSKTAAQTLLPHVSGSESESSSTSADTQTTRTAPDTDTTAAPKPTATAKPATTTEKQDDPVPTSSKTTGFPSEFSFLACPDNIIHPSVYYDCLKKAAEKKGVEPDYKKLEGADYDFASLYTNVAGYIKNADLSYVNVETLIGGEENGISGYPTFNTPEAAGKTLIDLGFDIYNLAHNHMLDSYNDKYLINCAKFFKDRGQTTIGYYKDKAATENIPVIECKGIKVAFLAYTFSTNGIKLPSSSTTYIPYADDDFMKKQITKAKKIADLVFISMHWGSEDTYSPNSEQRRVAQELCDWGVDAIIGMHSHVIQPMKWVENSNGRRTLLVYSLGNFISGMQDGFNMLGGMLSMNVYRDNDGNCGLKDVQFIPIVTHYVKKSAVRSDDTGHREYKIYLVKDYTEELASKHGVQIWDKSHKPTLVGGAFTKENLVATVKKYIPSEFLPSGF
ncbi:MAG: CapA family protein [Clostridia bacterium]|nr:CapA family protein [Clostridia bacterium]